MSKMNESQRYLNKEIQKANNEKEYIFKVYSNIVHSISQGKLLLLTKERMESFDSLQHYTNMIKIEKPEDVNEARTWVKQICVENKYDSKKLNKTLLVISEAVTNCLKHADKGVMNIATNANKVIIKIEDRGPGMELALLPKIIFMEGFSTKQSLGWGYNLIYKFSDRILLNTSNKGTTLILEFIIE